MQHAAAILKKEQKSKINNKHDEFHKKSSYASQKLTINDEESLSTDRNVQVVDLRQKLLLSKV